MAKIGRNETCPCGSGKKFKKCCAFREIVLAPESNVRQSSAQKILIKTLTNEFFQPMRLYYIIHDREKLETCLKKLKCMVYDKKLDDWAVQYIEEAAQIKLAVPPSKIPKEVSPLIIASVYIENENAMLIDIRSIERATKMIEFFDKYIPKTVTEITHVAIYNQLITGTKGEPTGNMDIDYDEIFNQKNITIIDPKKSIQEATEIAKQYSDSKERMATFSKYTANRSKEPLPKVEKFPVYYYEEGIDNLRAACMLRQMIAMQHYLGNKGYSFYDLIQELTRKIENFDVSQYKER